MKKKKNLQKLYPERDVPNFYHVCFWERKCDETSTIVIVCKGTTSPINAFAQANSLWAFHRNLGSVAEKRPHTRVLHMLLGPPGSGRQSRGHWRTDGCHKRHQWLETPPTASCFPKQAGRDGFLPHRAQTLLSPGPSLTMEYGGKTDIQCYSPTLFLFSAPT